ncbi:MAG: ABC transporter substrate-binding protein [Lachnospiraceae bacterium]|nr:ABC transporter substrate-binding protein [Lachnospiraceae bacterium]
MRNGTYLKRLTATAVLMALLTGCGGAGSPASTVADTAVDSASAVQTAGDTASEAQTTATEAPADASDSVSTEPALLMPDKADRVPLRVGSLKGPTTIGLLNLMHQVETNPDAGNFLYEFTMETDPAALSAQIVSGDLDVALVPANLASVLYNRTEGGVIALNINTLGVLECVSADESISHITDLAGKTVLSTGQGATPEYAIRYLLDQYGVTDCEIEFHSEAQEIAALLQENPDQIAVLPQPFATVATKQNEALSLRFALTDEWDALNNDSTLVTGVTVMRKELLDELGEEAAMWFLNDHFQSMIAAVENPDDTAKLIVEQEIIGAEPVAKAALWRCGIALIPIEGYNLSGWESFSSERMKTVLSGYLQTLFDADPQSVGGALPGDDFYLISIGGGG